MRSRTALIGLCAALVALTPGLALAYIGPGVGAGAIGAVLGFIGAVFLAIFAVVWYPVKRLLKGKKKPAAKAVGTKAGPASATTATRTAPPKSDA